MYMLLWGTMLLSTFRSYQHQLAYKWNVLGVGTKVKEPVRERFVLQQRRRLAAQRRYLTKVGLAVWLLRCGCYHSPHTRRVVGVCA